MKATIAGEINNKPVFIATMLDVTAEMLNSFSIMEASDQCICVIEKNSKIMLYANTKFYEMMGQNPSESMGGEHEAYVFFLNDQTNEKFNEKQLKNAQERFEMTLDNSDLYIWEYDIINSQCINPQKAVREYGLPPIIENYPESLFGMGNTPPETIEQIKEVKQRLLNGDTGFSVERRTLNSEGRSQWMKVSYSLEKDSAGRKAAKRTIRCTAKSRNSK